MRGLRAHQRTSEPHRPRGDPQLAQEFATVEDLAADVGDVVIATATSRTRPADFVNRNANGETITTAKFTFTTVHVEEALKGSRSGSIEARQDTDPGDDSHPRLQAGKRYVLFLASSQAPGYQNDQPFVHVRGMFEELASGLFLGRGPSGAFGQLSLGDLRSKVAAAPATTTE